MTYKKNPHCPCESSRQKKTCCQKVPRSARLAMRETVEALSKAGKHLEACELLEKLATLSPHNPLIWNDLGVQYEAAGQMDKALDALRRSHQADSTYPPALYNLGKFTLDRFIGFHKAGLATKAEVQEMLIEAIHLLNANLDRDPDNADGHYYLALAYGLNEDERMALAHMTVALRLRQASDTPFEAVARSVVR